MAQLSPPIPLNRRSLLGLAALVALAWLVAAAPLRPLLLLLGGSSALLLLIRWPWLIWPALAAGLPFTSAIKQGPVSLADLLLVGALVLWFADGVRRRTLRLEPFGLLLPLALYLSVLTLSALQAADLAEAAVEVVKWVQLGFVLLLVRAMVPRTAVRWLVVALLVGGIGQALLGLYQFIYRVGPEWFVILGRFMRASGSFGQPNPYAGYLGLTFPVALSLMLWAWHTLLWRGERRLDIFLWAGFTTLATGLMAAGLAASWSRGGWLGATAGVIVVCLIRSRTAAIAGGMAALLVAVAVLLGALQPSLVPAAITSRLQAVPTFLGLTDVLSQPVTDENFSIVERVAHWVAALRMWERAPWLGVGPGNYAVVYPEVRLLRWEEPLGHAHNIYLNVLGESGLLGLMAYLAFWLSAFVWLGRCLRGWQRSGATWSAALAVGVCGVLVHLASTYRWPCGWR
jgi:putative inorganic carbon (HCO3(-)) transporter